MLCKSDPNADKGGGGQKKPENFADVFYGCPLSLRSWAARVCREIASSDWKLTSSRIKIAGPLKHGGFCNWAAD